MLGTSPSGIMMEISLREWQIAGAAVTVAAAVGATYWLLTRHRPTLDEIEQQRRALLINYGRIVDGYLLDGFDITSEDDPSITRHMLLYTYEISGVRYECSQDITALADIADPAKIKLGMPCSIRYQPGSPENSILISERWSGLREGVSVQWLHPQESQTSFRFN